MGFLETFCGVVQKGAIKLKEMNDEVNSLYEEYQRKTDNELLRIAKGGNLKRRMAALKVLKERGYTSI